MGDNEAAHRLNDTLFNPSNLDPSMTPELSTSTSSFRLIPVLEWTAAAGASCGGSVEAGSAGGLSVLPLVNVYQVDSGKGASFAPVHKTLRVPPAIV